MFCWQQTPLDGKLKKQRFKVNVDQFGGPECLKELLWTCFWKLAIFCSDFKRRKEISIKYGLHVERAVNYLVKEKFVSILRFSEPKCESDEARWQQTH